MTTYSSLQNKEIEKIVQPWQNAGDTGSQRKLHVVVDGRRVKITKADRAFFGHHHRDWSETQNGSKCSSVQIPAQLEVERST